MAIEQVKAKARQHNLTDEQRSQLRERKSTEKAATESAFLKLNAEVWLPRLEDGAVVIEAVSMGGRALQTTLNEKKEAMIHERVMELLMDVQRRVFSTLNPGKIIDLFKLGEGVPPKLGSRTSEIVDGFFSFLGFTRLVTSGVIRKAIAKGIQEGSYGYTSQAVPELGSDGRYLVPLAKVRIATGVADDEIDLESGFIMLPHAVPQQTPAPLSDLVLTPRSGPVLASAQPEEKLRLALALSRLVLLSRKWWTLHSPLTAISSSPPGTPSRISLTLPGECLFRCARSLRKVLTEASCRTALSSSSRKLT